MFAKIDVNGDNAAELYTWLKAEQPGKVRAIVMARSNLNTLGAGDIAELSFERIGAGEARIEILYDSQLFAPQEANEGLVQAAPLVVAP